MELICTGPSVFVDSMGVEHPMSASDQSNQTIWVANSNEAFSGYRPVRLMPGVAVEITGPEPSGGQPFSCGA